MRRMKMLITLMTAATVGAAACASGGRSASTATQASVSRGATSASRYLVTEQELQGVGDRSAYEALQQLRPIFLRSRDTQTSSNPNPTPVAVFVNGGRTEGLEALKTIRANTIHEMRFYEPQDANTRFGTGHNGGAIAVTLK